MSDNPQGFRYVVGFIAMLVILHFIVLWTQELFLWLYEKWREHRERKAL